MASAARALVYEWDMLNHGADALATPTIKRNTLAQNIALESFLLHARIIRDFFKSKGRDNDVLARDFLTPVPRVKMPLLRSRSIDARLNRRLTHLSYSRNRLKRGWDVTRLLNEANGAMNKLVDRLEKEQPKVAKISGQTRRSTGRRV